MEQKFSRFAAAGYISAHYFELTSDDLKRHAHIGSGPLYRLVNGRAEYRKADLDTWAQSRISPRGRMASDLAAWRTHQEHVQ